MRALIVAPIAIVLMLLVSQAFAAFTGDALSAVLIELLLTIALVSCFTRGPAPGRQ